MWKKFNTCVYYKSSDFTVADKRFPLALFDMDGTLTGSASCRPWVVTDPEDWVYLGKVIDSFHKLKEAGWVVAIVSNQAKYTETIRAKFESIRQDMELHLGWSPFMFIATDKDVFRKPQLGTITLLLRLLKTTTDKVKHVLMSGDAIGDDPFPPYRYDTADFEFYNNLVEVFGSKNTTFRRPIDFFGTSLKPKLLSTKNTKEVILMVGNAGSGKSTVADMFVREKGYTLIRQDELRTKAKVLKTIRLTADRNLNMVIDATHPGLDKRDEMLEIPRSRGYAVRIMWCVRDGRPFNKLREDKIPDIAYYMYTKNFVRPTKDEGEVVYVY